MLRSYNTIRTSRIRQSLSVARVVASVLSLTVVMLLMGAFYIANYSSHNPLELDASHAQGNSAAFVGNTIDTNRFGIGIWQADPLRYGSLKPYVDLGINTFVHIDTIDPTNGAPNQSQLDTLLQYNTTVASDHKMLVFAQPTVAALSNAAQSAIGAYFTVDEPDIGRPYVLGQNGTCDTLPDQTLFQICKDSSVFNYAGKTWLTPSGYERIIATQRANKPSIPIYGNFGRGVIESTQNFAIQDWPSNYTDYEPNATLDSLQKRYVDAVDIASADYYPVAEGSQTLGTDAYAVGRITKSIKDRYPGKMTYAFIEAGCVAGSTTCATPDQTVAEVWSAVARGADGVVYFDLSRVDSQYLHNFFEGPHNNSTLNKSVATTNAVLSEIGLNALHDSTVSESSSLMVRYISTAKKYLIVVPKTPFVGSERVAIPVAGATNVRDALSGTNLALADGSVTLPFDGVSSVYVLTWDDPQTPQPTASVTPTLTPTSTPTSTPKPSPTTTTTPHPTATPTSTPAALVRVTVPSTIPRINAKPYDLYARSVTLTLSIVGVLSGLSATINGTAAPIQNGHLSLPSYNGDYKVVIKTTSKIYFSQTVRIRHPDYNRDNTTNVLDLNQLNSRIGKPYRAAYTIYDLNLDGKLNATDTSLLQRGWGK